MRIHSVLPRSRFLAVVLLLAGLAAVGYSVWFWKQQTRPGMAHYLKGMDYAAARHYRQAEREWLLGVKEDPASPQCYESLGDLYMQVRHPSEAAATYAAATRLSPQDGLLAMKLARADQVQGDVKDAASAAERAAKLLPNNAEAVGLYGLLAAKLKNKPEALAALRHASHLRPDDQRFLMGVVTLEMDGLDMQGAERDLSPYAQTHPHDGEICYMMAVIYNQKPRTQHNLQAALEYAQRAQIAMPHDKRIYNVLGQLYLDLNQPDDALRIYSVGRDLAPNNEDILHGLVVCYTRLGDSNKAASLAVELQKATARHNRIDYLTHAMGFNHLNTNAGLELARLEEEDGRDDLALAYYTQLVRQSPHDPGTHPALAQFLKRAGRPDLARQALRPDFMP